jgi:hypothetical protein
MVCHSRNGERAGNDGDMVLPRSPTTNGAGALKPTGCVVPAVDVIPVYRSIYASSISLIEVLVFLPTPDVTMSWRVPYFPLRRAAEPVAPGRFGMTSEGYS